MTDIDRRIQLLYNSARRLHNALELPRDRTWWVFMRREAWVSLKRSAELLWAILWRRRGEN